MILKPKEGILHDYDLHANHEPSAKKPIYCVICNTAPIRYQWADFSGEAMCTVCGAPYQLKWGTEEQEKEGAYPYLNIIDEWVPIIREYYEQTKKFACHGRMMGSPCPGLKEFFDWIDIRHPEMRQ